MESDLLFVCPRGLSIIFSSWLNVDEKCHQKVNKMQQYMDIVIPVSSTKWQSVCLDRVLAQSDTFQWGKNDCSRQHACVIGLMVMLVVRQLWGRELQSSELHAHQCAVIWSGRHERVARIVWFSAGVSCKALHGVTPVPSILEYSKTLRIALHYMQLSLGILEDVSIKISYNMPLGISCPCSLASLDGWTLIHHECMKFVQCGKSKFVFANVCDLR